MVLKNDGSKSAATSAAVAGDTTPQVQTPEVSLAPVTGDDWVYGNPDAPITLVEFSDLECPYCSSFHPTVKQLVSEYPDDVNWVYRHFPLTSIHPSAVARAEAAECAGELGGNDAFWTYIDAIFANQEQYNTVASLQTLGEQQGLKSADFATCLASEKSYDKIMDQSNQAIGAGGQGTPYSIIITPDGQKVPVNGAVPYAQVKSLVDSILQNN